MTTPNMLSKPPGLMCEGDRMVSLCYCAPLIIFPLISMILHTVYDTKDTGAPLEKKQI